jgi:hypothetical protein
MARRDPPTLLDLVEEPLNQVSGAIEVWAEADRLRSIASIRGSLLGLYNVQRGTINRQRSVDSTSDERRRMNNENTRRGG